MNTKTFNQQDAANCADRVGQIAADMLEGYRRMGELDNFLEHHGPNAPDRLIREAMCAWVIEQIEERR